MKELFKYLDNIRERLRGKYIMLFLDYDGTLTPIEDEPDKAVLTGTTKKVLADLSGLSNCGLAIISGRALADIKNKVGLKDIIYSGNHGLEIEGPKIKFSHSPLAEYGPALREIKKRLQKGLSLVKGALIEDKGISLALHYRKVDSKDIPSLKTIFHEAIAAHKTKKRIKVKTGKMVLEIGPPLEWDKGDVVLWLLSRQKFALGERPLLPVYIGDDRTDEDAFGALKNKGITVSVGGELGASPRAEYYLKDTQEVIRFLKWILEERKNHLNSTQDCT